MNGTALGGLQPVKLPPAPMTADHGVAVGWTAARVEPRGRRWNSARELALDPGRWAVPIPDERGASHDWLPDLAVWLPDSNLPVAVIVESGHRREDRQRRILEAWQSAVQSGRYSGVRYDCASASVAQRIKRLTNKLWLRSPEFFAAAQLTRDEILELIAEDPEPVASIASGPSPLVEVVVGPTERDNSGAERRAPTHMSAPVETRDESPPARPESPGDAAEQYREIFGIPEPGARRRWRR